MHYSAARQYKGQRPFRVHPLSGGRIRTIQFPPPLTRSSHFLTRCRASPPPSPIRRLDFSPHGTRGLKSLLWSFTPQGVVQRSPGLTDAGRSTLGVRQVAARTLKGFCRTSIPSVAFIEIKFRTSWALVRWYVLHNPFRVGALHITPTQGCPTISGNLGLR